MSPYRRPYVQPSGSASFTQSLFYLCLLWSKCNPHQTDVLIWESVVVTACLSLCVSLHCNIRTLWGLSWEKLMYTYVCARTPGAHNVHMKTCMFLYWHDLSSPLTLSHTHTHTHTRYTELQTQLTAVTWSFKGPMCNILTGSIGMKWDKNANVCSLSDKVTKNK